MSRTSQLFTIVLVSFALVLGVFAHIAATGTASGTVGNAVVQESLSLTGLERTVGQTTQETGWFDSSNDGTGGITYLRAASAGIILALVVAYSAWMLAVIPATRGKSTPGVLALLAGFGVVASMVLHHLGAGLHAQDTFGSSTYTMDNGLYTGVLVGVVLIVAGVQALVGSSTKTTNDPSEVQTSTFEVQEQHLMCPQCQSIQSAPVGTIPACASCGFATGLRPEMVG